MGKGASWVGEGELARVAKICHNVFLGVVIQSLAEITVLANKAGMPRHAFLEFLNQSVMGSTFSRYKSPALVNLDFSVTFTPELLRKDLDLGLEAGRKLGVPLPLASLTRDAIQALIGNGYGAERLRRADHDAGQGRRDVAFARERRASTTGCTDPRSGHAGVELRAHLHALLAVGSLRTPTKTAGAVLLRLTATCGTIAGMNRKSPGRATSLCSSAGPVHSSTSSPLSM